MAESLGARLRQRREEREVPLDTIADETKIKRSLLEALERDDVSRWPAGIFRRAYVRAYADAIGLDPDGVMREFLEVHPDPVEVVETLSARASAAPTSSGPPTRLRYLVDSAIGSLSRRRNGPAVESRPVAGDAPIARSLGSTRGPADPPEPPPATTPADGTTAMVPDDVPARIRPSVDPDLLAVARACTELGQVETAEQMPPLLEEVARLVDATGLVVWLWDARTEALRPALAHGYSAHVLAALPAVGRDADNATATAFRTAQTCVIQGSERSSGALALPLLTPAGCTGVLAVELPNGGEQTEIARALATIFAALLAQLTGGARRSEARESDPTARRA